MVGGGGVFVQAEDGMRELVRSRGLGDVYKRQGVERARGHRGQRLPQRRQFRGGPERPELQRGQVPGADPAVLPFLELHVDQLPLAFADELRACLLYTSDAADERSRGDIGGRGII